MVKIGSIFNTPNAIAAIISGTVAAIGIIIQTIVSISKQADDNRKSFDEILKNKLEKVFSPLKVLLFRKTNDIKIIDDEILRILKEYGYLLPTSLLEDFIMLSNIEKSIHNTDNTSDLYQEYDNLKNKVIDGFESEYLRLQSIYNNNFEQSNSKINFAWNKKIMSICRVSFIIITISFYIIISLDYYLKFVNSLHLPGQSLFMNVILFTYISIAIITTSNLSYRWIGTILVKIRKFLKDVSNVYMSGEHVPKTALYKCRICGEEKKFYEYSKFPSCSKPIRKRNFMKNLIIFSQWKMKPNDDISSDRQNQTNNEISLDSNNNESVTI